MSPECAAAPVAAPGPLSLVFDLDGLAELRRRLAAYAGSYGLTGRALDGFVLATNEIVANAIAHGGGRGRLRLWCDGTQLRCQVSDAGPGLPAVRTAVGATGCPPLSEPDGRGLWLARQYCEVDIRTSRYGTTVELRAAAAGLA